MKKFLLTLITAIAFSTTSSFAQEKSGDVMDAIKTPPALNLESLKQELPYDISYGSKDAPVKIVEYASLSCPHCKHFQEEVFKELEKTYIKDGKVKYVFRHFPLNLQALKAAMLVECAPQERRAIFLDAVFKSQNEWALEKDEKSLITKLRSIAQIGGLSDEQFDACLKNDKQEKAILDNYVKASNEVGIDSTPTIFINGEKFTRIKNIKNVKDSIDQILDTMPGNGKK